VEEEGIDVVAAEEAEEGMTIAVVSYYKSA
jgi:hypothetical protein